MNTPRRTYLILATATLISALALPAWADQPIIEIIAFKHPPVTSALKPLRDWLASQGNKLRTVEIDMESPEAEKRLAAIGLKGHIPIVVLVDGKYKHRRKDGSAVEFVSFPNNAGALQNTKLSWSMYDVQDAIKNR
jgi:hypothetical protein